MQIPANSSESSLKGAGRVWYKFVKEKHDFYKNSQKAKEPADEEDCRRNLHPQSVFELRIN